MLRRTGCGPSCQRLAVDPRNVSHGARVRVGDDDDAITACGARHDVFTVRHRLDCTLRIYTAQISDAAAAVEDKDAVRSSLDNFADFPEVEHFRIRQYAHLSRILDRRNVQGGITRHEVDAAR